MFRLNRYLIITIVVALLFVADKCAIGASGTEIAHSQPAEASDAANITSLIALIVARGLASRAMPDPSAGMDTVTIAWHERLGITRHAEQNWGASK
jgi:hypothetical protein